MKNLWWVAAACAAAAGPALAADDADSPYKPFIVLDSSTEKDSLSNEYIAANITIGVKAPNKVEYSIKSGISIKDAASGSNSISSNIEGKIKKSYDIGTFFTPYVALRLGQKINYNTTSFTHYAFDAGMKIPMTTSTALDVGVRHRDAFDSDEKFKSFRVHTTLLWDINPSNTVGLRYTKSEAPTNAEAEERETWRIHWQHNY